jgi:hypothetical protein
MIDQPRNTLAVWIPFAIRVAFGCVCLGGFFIVAVADANPWGFALLPPAMLAFARAVWRLRRARRSQTDFG